MATKLTQEEKDARAKRKKLQDAKDMAGTFVIMESLLFLLTRMKQLDEAFERVAKEKETDATTTEIVDKLTKAP